MQKRNTQQRRNMIMQTLQLKGDVAVDELSLKLQVSEVTIRKDLAALELSGLLLRKFGGAVMPQQDASELTMISPAKTAIAKMAASLIQDHDRIIIDSGSTTAALIPELRHKRGLVIMTNCLYTANAILEQDNSHQLLMTGGTWDQQSHSFQGKMAENTVSAYNFDFAFVGASGIDINHGTTTFNELTQLTQTIAQVSKEVVVMAECSKISRKMPNQELGWQQISILITDQQMSETSEQLITHKGVKVFSAPLAQ